MLSRTYHESAVNSAGLAALRIGPATPDPPGGRIVRDRRGRPTGVLLESASFQAEMASRPDPRRTDWRARLADHARRLLGLGITRVGDAAVPAELAGEVVAACADVGLAVTPLLVAGRIDIPAFVAGGIGKVLADGGEYCDLCMDAGQLGRATAASARAALGRERNLARAVAGRTGRPRRAADGKWHTGISYPQQGDLLGLMRAAAAAGSAMAVHAVGNGAVADLLAAVRADPGLADEVRLRVEHAMVLDPELVAALAQSGIPVVTQPGFLPAYGHELELVAVPEPLRLMPIGQLARAGADIVLSSDYPATEVNPFATIAAALTRADRTGTPIHPEEAVDLPGALVAHTVAGARSLGCLDAGSLEPGMRADMIWCDRDPHTCPPEQLAEIRVQRTWSAGEPVAPAAPGPA